MSSKVNASLVEREVEHCREQHEKPDVRGTMAHEERRGGGDRSGTEKVEGVLDHTARGEFGDRCASRLNQEEAPRLPPTILECAPHPEGNGIHQMVLNREAHGQTCIFKRSLRQQA